MTRTLVEERARRIAQNQAVFRRINERLDALNEAFGELTNVIEIVCECGDPACATLISIPVDEYERLRADPTYFAVVPGHAVGDVESVVSEGDRYVVVRKRPLVSQAIAAETDPRA